MQFDLTTETDGGLTLGVRQRFQTEENNANDGGNEARFFASAGGLTVAMGNIIGVIEAAPNLYLPTKSAGVGLEGNGFSSLAAQFATPGIALSAATAEYEDAFGELATGESIAITAPPLWTAYQSAGQAQDDDGVEVIYSMNGIGLHAHSTDNTYGIGANYKFADYTVAVAYEEYTKTGAFKGSSILFASVGGKFGAFDAALAYAKGDYKGTRVNFVDATSTTLNAPVTTALETGIDWEAEKVVLKGGYQVNDAAYVYGFVATEDNNIDVSVDESFGLGASYALGGGASVEGGWTQNAAGDNIVSAGVFFSF